MKKETIYVCDHCDDYFFEPCEKHEIECEKRMRHLALMKKAANRVEPLFNLFLGEKINGEIAAKINGVWYLIPSPLTKKAIKSFSIAAELTIAGSDPTDKDAAIIRKANEILAS